MKQSVIIIGASGHGKVVADIVERSGDVVKGFLDDNSELPDDFLHYPVLGCVDDFHKYLEASFVIAIGNAGIREKIAEKMGKVSWYTAIHPEAVISQQGVSLGAGTVVAAGAVINPGAKIGRHCIINSGAVVEHDDCLGDYVHVSVGAKLAGTVVVGDRTWIGIGAVVSNNLRICEDCMIGAGAVVVKDIEWAGTYVGVPAKKLE